MVSGLLVSLLSLPRIIKDITNLYIHGVWTSSVSAFPPSNNKGYNKPNIFMVSGPQVCLLSLPRIIRIINAYITVSGALCNVCIMNKACNYSP